MFMLWLPLIHAQQLLDRVLARVDTAPITLTDVQSAIGLGIAEIGSADAVAEGTQRMIDRQLELAEVQRFPPPERTAVRAKSSLRAVRARRCRGRAPTATWKSIMPAARL